jgi:ParB family chromosome partitioning protein
MNRFEEIKEVEIKDIQINPYQPRRHFCQENLTELADSIRSVGFLHPPLVKAIEGTQCYELISGERRLRAAELLGLHKIPVVVRPYISDSVSAQAALIENIQRVDLNPLEVARALQRLILEFNFTQEVLAKKIGKKRSTVANYLRILNLPASIQAHLANGTLTLGHAKAILSLENVDQQLFLNDLIIRDGLSVRATEQAAQCIANKKSKPALKYVTRDFYLEQLSDKLQQRLGTKVAIQGMGKKGRITIHYYNLDDLDRLLHILGIE